MQFVLVFTMFSSPFWPFQNQKKKSSRDCRFPSVAETFRILPGVGDQKKIIRNVCVLQWFLAFAPSPIRPRAHIFSIFQKSMKLKIL